MSHDSEPHDPGPASEAGRSPLDPVVGGWHVRVVQPYQATKVYRCPGCDHEIRRGVLHVVAWPEGSPEERRHWHRPCWERHLAELRRRWGRRRRA